MKGHGGHMAKPGGKRKADATGPSERDGHTVPGGETGATSDRDAEIASAPEPLDCIDLVELVTDYFEGALDPLERRRLEHHISECPGCATYLEQMLQTIRAVGHLESADLPPESIGPLLAVLRSYRGS